MRARWHVFTLSVFLSALLASSGAAQEGPFTLEQTDRPARPQPVERNKTVEQQTLDRYRRTSGVQRR